MNLTLPNSKITVHTPVVYCKFANSGKEKSGGVIPDYYFIPAFIDGITGNERQEEFIFNLIKKKETK